MADTALITFTIENEQDAAYAIAAVAAWLAIYREPLRAGEYGIREETRAALLARDYAGEMLEAGGADGCCGCPYCRG